MKDFTFLTEKHVYGNNALDIIQKFGTKCAITDFSILLGGRINSEEQVITGAWFLRDKGRSVFSDRVSAVDCEGYSNSSYVEHRVCGARPAIPYVQILSIASNKVRNRYGILEVEYGEYPQTVVSEDFSNILESAFIDGTINKTGKIYTTDSILFSSDKSFESQTHIEYEYNGKKYIRFLADIRSSGDTLSDRRIIQKGNIYWVQVEPIKWLIDEKEDIALSKKLIFSGVQFNRDRYNGDFLKKLI